jgi:hypothetical protein
MSVAVALSLVLGLLLHNTARVSAVSTAVLTSPALPSNADQFMQCNIVNVTPATKNVTVQAVDSNGVVQGSMILTLFAGQGSGLSLTGVARGFYCRFAVDKADDYRASIAVLGAPLDGSGQGTLISSLPAW